MGRLVIGLFVVAALAAVGYCYWKTTPFYAFQETAYAIKKHDLEGFKDYVDIDSVARNLFDDLLVHPIASSPALNDVQKQVAVGAIGLTGYPVKLALVHQIEDCVSGRHTIQNRGIAQPASPNRLRIATQPSGNAFQQMIDATSK